MGLLTSDTWGEGSGLTWGEGSGGLGLTNSRGSGEGSPFMTCITMFRPGETNQHTVENIKLFTDSSYRQIVIKVPVTLLLTHQWQRIFLQQNCKCLHPTPLPTHTHKDR